MSETEFESSLSVKETLISLQLEEIKRLRSEIRAIEKMLQAEIEQREAIISLLHDYKTKNHTEVKL